MGFFKTLKNNKKNMILMIILGVFVVGVIGLNIYNAMDSSDEDAIEAETETDEDGNIVYEEDTETAEAEETTASGSSYTQSSELTITGETLTTTILEPCVQVGSTTLYLGVATVQDIVDAGAEFTEDSQAEVVEFSEDPLETRELEFVYGDTTLYTTVQNPLDEIAQLKDSVLTSAYWEGSDVCGIAGVQVGNTVDELIEKMGEPYLLINSENYDFELGSLPSTSRVYVYTDELDHVVFRCTVDRNTYLVNHIEELPANVLITDADEITTAQFVQLIEDYNNSSSSSDFDTVSYKMTLDAAGTSTSVESLTFKKVQVATIKDLTDDEDISSFYEAKAGKYLYTSYLFVEYSAVLSLSDGSTVTGIGGFVVYDPYIDAAGNITSDYSFKKINYAYDSSSVLAESIITGSIAYAPTFSFEDYTLSIKGMVD